MNDHIIIKWLKCLIYGHAWKFISSLDNEDNYECLYECQRCGDMGKV